jgi:MOSC domain-containing protein YiiM
MSKSGRIVAVCTSQQAGLPKHVKSLVVVGSHGLRGDYHAGETRLSHRTGKPKLNDRQVSVVALEACKEIGDELGVAILPGYFGENILTEGLGNLSDIEDGMLLQIGEDIVIQVTEQNVPCDQLNKYHPRMLGVAAGRRGVLAIVIKGEGLRIIPGDTISALEVQKFPDWILK